MTLVCADVKEVMRQDMGHALTTETLSMEGKSSHYAMCTQSGISLLFITILQKKLILKFY